MKRILILGGTMFVGRLLTERLMAAGNYDITLFNRRKSNAGLFKSVKHLQGDRETADIEKIYGQSWDCIIDFSGYYPNSFQNLLNRIDGGVGRYIFISTISVYDIEKYAGQVITEQFVTQACNENQKVSRLPDAYGEKKAEMERILLQHNGFDKIIFRPGFIYGKYDWTERFYYWLYRVQNCDRFLLPDEGTPQSLSLTNADDLAEALVIAIEANSHAEVYNAISTPATSIRQLIQVAANTYGKNPELITTGDKQLAENGLNLSQFPLLMPIGFEVDDVLWQKDFPFKRRDITEAFLQMRDYNLAAGALLPKVGLDVAQEQELIKKNYAKQNQ